VATGGYLFWRKWICSKRRLTLFGDAAATCTTISFLPQLIRVVRLRSAKDISLGMFSIFSAGTAMWLAYGLLSHTWPVAAANVVTLVLSFSILVLKLR
jgi:MtN3 and saliva related transmembrane protein